MSNTRILFWLNKLVEHKTKLLAEGEDLSFSIKAVEKAIEEIKKIEKEITSGKEALKIKGIGKGIATRIDEILTTGRLKEIDEGRTKEKYLDLTVIPGVGPVRARKLFEQYQITSLEELLSLYQEGKLTRITHQMDIGLKYHYDLQEKIPRTEMEEIKKVLEKQLKGITFEICGSFRRKLLESSDVDVLITGTKLETVVKILKDSGFLLDSYTQNATKKYMGVCKVKEKARHIDIKLIAKESWGSAVLHFTGSKDFNIYMRNLAIERGWLLNEYGLFDQDKKRVSTSEKGIFEALGIEYTEPKDR